MRAGHQITLVILMILFSMPFIKGQILPPPPTPSPAITWPDWISVDPVVIDPLNDESSGTPNGDFYRCFIANNESFLFFLVEINPEGILDPQNIFYYALLDTDQNMTTGYIIEDVNIGGDYLIIFGYTYGEKYYPLLTQWDPVIDSYGFIKYLSFERSNTTLSIAVPILDIDFVESSSFNIIFANNVNSDTTDIAPDDGFITFQYSTLTSTTTAFTSLTSFTGNNSITSLTGNTTTTSTMSTFESTAYSTVTTIGSTLSIPGFSTCSIIVGVTIGLLNILRRNLRQKKRTK